MFKDSLGKLTRGEELSDAEMTEFIENMRDDVVTEVQIAGFLVALVMKGPTVDEVAAIVRAMRANCVQITPRRGREPDRHVRDGRRSDDVQRQLRERDPDRRRRRPGRQARQPLDLGLVGQRRRARGARDQRRADAGCRASS